MYVTVTGAACSNVTGDSCGDSVGNTLLQSSFPLQCIAASGAVSAKSFNFCNFYIYNAIATLSFGRSMLFFLLLCYKESFISLGLCRVEKLIKKKIKSPKRLPVSLSLSLFFFFFFSFLLFSPAVVTISTFLSGSAVKN